MRIFIFSSLISFILILTACDPLTDYSEKIYNNSDQIIEIQMLKPDSLGNSISFDTIILASKSTHVLYVINEIGSSVDNWSDCPNVYTDNILITTNNFSDTIQKDPKIANHWSWIVIEEYFPKGGICECEFIVEQGDL